MERVFSVETHAVHVILYSYRTRASVELLSDRRPGSWVVLGRRRGARGAQHYMLLHGIIWLADIWNGPCFMDDDLSH
jgi:hypothetical protein